jgi:hypothetical protein
MRIRYWIPRTDYGEDDSTSRVQQHHVPGLHGEKTHGSGDIPGFSYQASAGNWLASPTDRDPLHPPSQHEHRQPEPTTAFDGTFACCRPNTENVVSSTTWTFQSRTTAHEWAHEWASSQWHERRYACTVGRWRTTSARHASWTSINERLPSANERQRIRPASRTPATNVS